MGFPAKFDATEVVNCLFIDGSPSDLGSAGWSSLDSGYTIVQVDWLFERPGTLEDFEEGLKDILPPGTVFRGHVWDHPDGDALWCRVMIAFPCRLEVWRGLWTYLVFQGRNVGVSRLRADAFHLKKDIEAGYSDMEHNGKYGGEANGRAIGERFVDEEGEWTLPPLDSSPTFRDGVSMWKKLMPSAVEFVDSALLSVWHGVKRDLERGLKA